MGRRPHRLIALLGCAALVALVLTPASAPAGHGIEPEPEGGVLPAPAPGVPLFPPGAPVAVLKPVPVLVPGSRVHRIEVPPYPPPRIHRLHLIPPTLELMPYEAPVISSDVPPVLYNADPEAGLRLGAPELLTPGALPDGFRYHYNDDYHGWPVRPLHAAHAIHGAFNDPREGGYHFGVDIAVDDSKPALLAPSGMSHRIFAVESGTMHYTNRNEMAANCNDRRFEIGHFAYWHASPSVPDGTPIRAGEMIGWTCLNEWHVHLSEWALVNGQRAWVNPLHAGGKLLPYVDEAKPAIRAVYAYGPPAGWWKPMTSGQLSQSDGAQRLAFGDLHGAVDLRAQIDDSQGDVGIYKDAHQLVAGISPYRVWVQIKRVDDGAIVWQRNAWQSDLLLSGREPYYAHFAAGSRPPLADYYCAHGYKGCAGRLLYHLVVSGGQYLWDTASVRNGAYVLTVRAYDISGNMDERQVPITVSN